MCNKNIIAKVSHFSQAPESIYSEILYMAIHKYIYSALCIIRTQKIRENLVELYQNRIIERANWPWHTVYQSASDGR